MAAIYKPSLLDKFKDFVNGLKSNWDIVESHLAESSSKHITESGSNENGRYIKFDDGTMICQRTVNPDRSIVNEEQSFSYPMGFISTPFVSASHQWGVNTAYKRSCGSMFLSGDTDKWRVAFTESTSVGRTIDMYLMAIGRWK